MSVHNISKVVVTAAVAVLFLAACQERTPAPKAVAPTVEAPRAVTVKDWGPREAKRGQTVNRQPDGSSAIWIAVTGIAVDPATKVIFGGKHASPAAVAPDGVTAVVPKAVIDTAGDHEVVIEEPGGRRINVGTFRVLP